MLCPCCDYLRIGNCSRLSVLPHWKISNVRFERALASQPAMKDLQGPIFHYIGALLVLIGNTLVITSMYALGITGTYLGTKLEGLYLLKATISGF